MLGRRFYWFDAPGGSMPPTPGYPFSLFPRGFTPPWASGFSAPRLPQRRAVSVAGVPPPDEQRLSWNVGGAYCAAPPEALRRAFPEPEFYRQPGVGRKVIHNQLTRSCCAVTSARVARRALRALTRLSKIAFNFRFLAIRKYRAGNETYISTFGRAAQAHPRLSGPHENARRTQRHSRTPRQGPPPPRRLVEPLARGTHPRAGQARRL